MYVGYKIPETRYHITLTFNGHEETKSDYKRAVLATARAALYSGPFVAIMSGDMEKFGPTQEYWVTLVDSPGLITMHDWVAHFMDEYEVGYSTDFDYRPHITLTKFKKPKPLTGELLIDRLHVVSKEFGDTEVKL